MTDNNFQERFEKARRTIIGRSFAHLNPVQQQAVLATEGPLLLLAGAGSGKTTVLINRIANILKYGRGSDSHELPDNAGERELEILERCAADPAYPNVGYVESLCALEPAEPWRVLAITFTNKAAGELKSRLSLMLGTHGEDVWALTFHSACVRILRRDIELTGFASGFTIYDTADSLSILKRILKELDIDDRSFPPRSILAEMGKAKDARISAQKYISEAGNDYRRKKIGEVYLEYTRRLKASNAMDFDDLLFYTVKLLLENEEVRSYYQRRFRYVLVDEYQDTNNLQYIFASTIAGGYENICVVGDDDQSIYKFRGATIENILSFESHYKEARTIKLEQNYRSSNHILSAANAVIKNNAGRKGKELWTQRADGDKLTLFTAFNEHEEAAYVAARILDFFSSGEPFGHNAVLYRMNAQSNQLEYAFKREGIPYRVIGGTRFFDRKEIKDALAYLCAVASPSDDLRVLRIINTPPRGIGARTIEAAADIAGREGLSIFSVLERSADYPELKRASDRLLMFVSLIHSLRNAADNIPLDELYDILLEKSGYIKMLEQKDSDEDISRLENIRELKTNINQYMESTQDSSLAGFLDEIALYTGLDELDTEQDAVTMMTMHSAKGLEFPNVFIVGAEEGIFPSVRSIGEPGEMEEERRLCYVAITRAKNRLFLCSARQRMLFGRTTSSLPSRFIAEIPAENIETPNDYRPSVSFGGTGFSSFTETPAQYKERPIPADKPAAKKPNFSRAPAVLPSYQVGDRVSHKAFGDGEISKMTPMGNDSLIEIEFIDVGVKRLMLKAASVHMTKQ